MEVTFMEKIMNAVESVIEEVVNDRTKNSLKMIPDEIAATNETKASTGTKTKSTPKNVDIKPVLTALPPRVTPRDLDQMFGLNDGGKTIRRHLRKRFGDAHNMKESWEWAKGDPILDEILKYFAERYNVELKDQGEAKAN